MVSLPSPTSHFPVVIIGGGPAGCAAASWLARQGRRVALFERERHPRFHIGESLLPNANRVLKQIGAWEKIEAAGFIEKRGAEFTVPNRSQSILEVFMTPKPPMGLDRAVNSALAGCLNPPFAVRWRFLVFRLICRLHRRFALVPKLNW